MAEYINGGLTKAFLTGSVNYAGGGYIKAYVGGTTTPTSTYNTLADAIARTNPQEWPVELDSQGQRVIAVSGATDVFCYDAQDNELWSVLGLDTNSQDIIGPDGSILLHFISNDNAINGWSIENATTGTGPIISTYGGDTNITGYITSKGSGNLYLEGGVNGQVVLGETSTGNILLKRPVVASNTITQTTTISSATLSAGVSNPSTVNQAYRIQGQGNLGTFAQGSVTGSYATVPSGFIGEIIQVGPSTLNMAPSTTYNMAQIDLTPGNWRVTGYGWCNQGGGTMYGFICSINTVVAINNNYRTTFGAWTPSCGFCAPERVIHVVAPTRIYLVGSYGGDTNAQTVIYFYAHRYS